MAADLVQQAAITNMQVAVVAIVEYSAEVSRY
jgi:hypothetical protein